MTPRDAIAYLAEVLCRIKPLRGTTFAGVGLLLYREAADLPISPLREQQPAELPVARLDDIVTALLRYATLTSPYHDGFHLLSLDGHLTHAAHYFAPPIVRDLPREREPLYYGGRYRAAQYGSCLPEVVASGVLTHHYGPVLFVDGVPRFMEM